MSFITTKPLNFSLFFFPISLNSKCYEFGDKEMNIRFISSPFIYPIRDIVYGEAERMKTGTEAKVKGFNSLPPGS